MPTPSTMMPLSTAAPGFSLPDVTTGDTVSLSDFDEATALLVMFLSNHCPYVQHVAHQLADLGTDYDGTDVAIVAIISNDVDDYPADSPEATAAEVARRGYVFPYLHDADQSVARAYTAACTPDFFLFDSDRTLVYRGFDGVAGLQQALLSRPELFAGTLTEKLLTYALGRGIEPYDAPAVREIVRKSQAEDFRFSSLVLGIANSTPFQMRRSR